MSKLSSALKRIVLIALSVVLLLLTIWLGYSFFSMTSDTPHLQTEIDLSEDMLAKKVPVEEYINDGRYISYKYPIKIYEISFDDDDYTIGAYANKFLDYFDDIERAKFSYALDKDKGKFDFSQLGPDQGMYIKKEYRLEKNLKYYLEYSVCTLQNVINKNKYENKCVINREAIKWKIEII